MAAAWHAATACPAATAWRVWRPRRGRGGTRRRATRRVLRLGSGPPLAPCLATRRVGGERRPGHQPCPGNLRQRHSVRPAAPSCSAATRRSQDLWRHHGVRRTCAGTMPCGDLMVCHGLRRHHGLRGDSMKPHAAVRVDFRSPHTTRRDVLRTQRRPEPPGATRQQRRPESSQRTERPRTAEAREPSHASSRRLEAVPRSPFATGPCESAQPGPWPPLRGQCGRALTHAHAHSHTLVCSQRLRCVVPSVGNKGGREAEQGLRRTERAFEHSHIHG